jgi:hypothetical protein
MNKTIYGNKNGACIAGHPTLPIRVDAPKTWWDAQHSINDKQTYTLKILDVAQKLSTAAVECPGIRSGPKYHASVGSGSQLIRPDHERCAAPTSQAPPN